MGPDNTPVPMKDDALRVLFTKKGCIKTILFIDVIALGDHNFLPTLLLTHLALL